jgi:hypothetical protein
MRTSELKVCASISEAVHLVATAKQKPMVYIRGQRPRSVFARLRVEKHVLLISGPFGGVLIAEIAAGTHSN